MFTTDKLLRLANTLFKFHKLTMKDFNEKSNALNENCITICEIAEHNVYRHCFIFKNVNGLSKACVGDWICTSDDFISVPVLGWFKVDEDLTKYLEDTTNV